MWMRWVAPPWQRARLSSLQATYRDGSSCILYSLLYATEYSVAMPPNCHRWQWVTNIAAQNAAQQASRLNPAQIKFPEPVRISQIVVSDVEAGASAMLRLFASDLQAPGAARFAPLCSSTVRVEQPGSHAFQPEVCESDRYRSATTLLAGKAIQAALFIVRSHDRTLLQGVFLILRCMGYRS